MQRRVEQPDRDREPLHRAEDGLEVARAAWAAAWPARASGPPCPAPRSSPAWPVSRSPSKNMCSVRQSPMPSAPKSRPRCASAGVSALTRTRSWRIRSAHCMSRRKSPLSSGGPQRRLAGEHLAGAAVHRDPLALRELPAVHGQVARALVHLRAPARRRRTACPCPRATTAACEVMPPARGEDRLGHHHAVEVLGRGLPPHQDHRLARAAQLLGAVGVEHDGAARRARARRGGRW